MVCSPFLPSRYLLLTVNVSQSALDVRLAHKHRADPLIFISTTFTDIFSSHLCVFDQSYCPLLKYSSCTTLFLTSFHITCSISIPHPSHIPAADPFNVLSRTGVLFHLIKRFYL